MGNQASLPEHVFDEVVKTLLQQFGDEWIANVQANHAFVQGTIALVADSEGIHLIGVPAIEQHSLNFDLWIDFPVDDLMVADDVAFSLFSGLAEDIFISTRIFEDRGVRYRFVTGNVHEGHVGSLHFTGPHALAFVAMHRMRVSRRLLFNA